jgi:D-threo-aldose 1-dehydrogenase
MATPRPAEIVDPAARTRLGRTDLEVSRLCFGTSALASMPEHYGYAVEDNLAAATIRAIFRGPVNFLDTSRNYGFGRAEERVGGVIREMGGLPEGFVLSTKLDADFETGKFDAAAARRSLEDSLEALSLDRFQLLYLHDPEYAKPLDDVTRSGGALSELMRIKEEGLADAVGLAAGPIDLMLSLAADWDFDAFLSHNRYTLVNRSAGPLMDFAAARGIAFLNAAPFASGILAKGSADPNKRFAYRPAPERVLARVRDVEAVCARHGIPVGAAALQFSLRDPRIASTVCGVTKPERVEQMLEWGRWPIPEAAWADLAALPFDTHDPQREER